MLNKKLNNNKILNCYVKPSKHKKKYYHLPVLFEIGELNLK